MQLLCYYGDILSSVASPVVNGATGGLTISPLIPRVSICQSREGHPGCQLGQRVPSRPSATRAGQPKHPASDLQLLFWFIICSTLFEGKVGVGHGRVQLQLNKERQVCACSKGAMVDLRLSQGGSVSQGLRVGRPSWSQERRACNKIKDCLVKQTNSHSALKGIRRDISALLFGQSDSQNPPDRAAIPARHPGRARTPPGRRDWRGASSSHHHSALRGAGRMAGGKERLGGNHINLP